MVAKKNARFPSASFVKPRCIKVRTIFRISRSIAPESDVLRPPEHTFVGRKPPKSEIHCNLDRLVGNRAFGRPQPRGRLSKHALVELPRPQKLLARILRESKGRLRQWRVWIGHSRDIRIAKQWKDWVVIRRRRNFDLPSRRREPVFRQNCG